MVAGSSALIVDAGLLELKELLVARLAVLEAGDLADADDLPSPAAQPFGLNDDVDRERTDGSDRKAPGPSRPPAGRRLGSCPAVYSSSWEPGRRTTAQAAAAGRYTKSFGHRW